MIPLTLVIKKFLFKDKKSRMSVEVNCLQPAQYIMYGNLQSPVSSPDAGGLGCIRKMGCAPMETAYDQESCTQI